MNVVLHLNEPIFYIIHRFISENLYSSVSQKVDRDTKIGRDVPLNGKRKFRVQSNLSLRPLPLPLPLRPNFIDLTYISSLFYGQPVLRSTRGHYFTCFTAIVKLTPAHDATQECFFILFVVYFCAGRACH